MLKAKTSSRPDKQLEKTLIALVYAVVALVFCLMMLFVFPQYSLFLLMATLAMAVLSIALAIGVLNSSEEALTYGGFANEILNSSELIKRIDNNKGEAVIENKPAQKFFKDSQIMEALKNYLFDERQNKLNFQRLELALKSLKKESVTLNLTEDNQEQWYLVSVRPIYLKKNDIFEEEFSINKIQKETYFLWTLENITAEKNMEKIFEEERKKLNRFINRMPVGIYVADTNFKLEYVNDTLAAQLGLENSKLVGTQLQSLVVENQALFDITMPDFSGLTFFKDANGENFETFVVQNSYQDGSEIKICGLTFEHMLTNQKVTAEMNFAKDEISNLIEASPYGLILVAADGTIERMNNRATEIAMVSNNNPQSLSDIFDNAALKQLQPILQTASVSDSQTPIRQIETRLKSAKNICIHVAPRLYVHQKQKTFGGLVLYLNDTTEQKDLEYKFAQAQKMQAMGQLAGGIAHDFNNLLTAMIGFCDLLLQRHGIGDPSFADLIQIKQNANRAAGLVRQLLAFSRKQPLKPKRIDVTENFMELSHLMRRILGEQIILEFNHGRDLGFIKVDPVQFSQVIINLAVNAKDAMSGKGRLDITTRVERLNAPYQFGADTIAPGDFVVISVADTGCGIPQENLNRIFEPFFSTKQNVVGSGTGLGLAMVYGIVRQTEGFIKVESEVGKGTAFSIYLPRFDNAEEDDENAGVSELQPATALGSQSSGQNGQKLILGLNVSTLDHTQDSFKNPQDIKILFVEDEDSVRTFGVRALKKKGFSVTACSNAENALELVDKGEKFSLLVTDMVMPGMSGTELAQEISRRQPEIKIILASGYSEEIARRELKGTDNFVFIAKPYSLGDLGKKVSEILDGSRLS